METFRTAARLVADHWILVLAILVNLAIAAPAEAVRYDNDVCSEIGGNEVYPCCTACWFFCDCDQFE